MSREQTLLVEDVPTFYSVNDVRARQWRHTYSRWKEAQISPLVLAAVREQDIQPVQSYPVEVYVKVLYGKGNPRYDWENNAIIAKVIQDSLIDHGILENDSCRCISRGTIAPARHDRPHNSVLYHIIEP